MIRKSDIGRFIVWTGSVGNCVGRVDGVRNRMASVSYPLRGVVYHHVIGVRDKALQRYAKFGTDMVSAEYANNAMVMRAESV